MTEQELNMITDWLIENIIENPDIMFSDGVRAAGQKMETFKTINGLRTEATAYDLVALIVYLHNKIYEIVTGKPYEYMFHWANKIGSYVGDEELQACKHIIEDDPEDITPNGPWWKPQ